MVFVSEDEKKRYALELKEKFERDIIDSEEYIREKHFTEGIAVGIAEGELKVSLKAARALLKENIPIETISEITGLSLDEINKL